MVNWKRGITRIYIVLWALWFLVLAFMATPLYLMDRVGPTMIVLGIWGLVIPGCVLIGLRWAIDGFGFEKRG